MSPNQLNRGKEEVDSSTSGGVGGSAKSGDNNVEVEAGHPFSESSSSSNNSSRPASYRP